MSMRSLFITLGICLFLIGCTTGNLVKKVEKPEEVVLEKYIQTLELQSLSDVTIIDLREPWKYNAGHLPNSINIPFGEIDGTRLQAEGVWKDERIILYDDGGGRSTSAYEILSRSSFEKVQILDGGINSWINSELVLEQTY